MLRRYIAGHFLRSLGRIHTGTLDMTMPDGKLYHFAGQNPGPSVKMNIHDWAVPHHLAAQGDVGLAQDYRAGLWDTDNLEDMITLALLNEDAVQRYIFGCFLPKTLDRISYWFKRNTLKGSRRNIREHYDLGNDFYKLWLDPTMTYSAGIFGGQADLKQAQINKYDRILDILGGATANDNAPEKTTEKHILEIGCGWGGFAERAAQRGEYRVKGITLSDEQYVYSQNRLAGNADIVLEDYRAQVGKFDHIVSIEMFEAVGEHYWPAYFGKVSSLLKEKGKAVIQTITIDDKLFDAYRGGNDFIRSFIFPGGMLPSPAKFEAAANQAGLKVSGKYAFGQDYAETMRHWLSSFDSKIAQVKALGFDDGFIRLWRFYLAGCIAGFRTGRTNVMQMELSHA